MRRGPVVFYLIFGFLERGREGENSIWLASQPDDMCAYICMYIYIYIYTYTSIYIYICIYAYMHICIYAYMHICIYAYTHCMHAHTHAGVHISIPIPSYDPTQLGSYICMHACNAMQCNATQCNAMQCKSVQGNSSQCNAMQCNVM